jgi:hypothetical protein
LGEFPQGESTAGAEADGGAGESGDLGEFPQGESTADAQDGADEAPGDAAEPGFGGGEYAAGEDDALPDLRDEPSLEDALESFEETMGEAGRETTAGDLATAGSAGDPAGESGSGSSSAQRGANAGPLTPAEEVTILNGQLEREMGEFDDMILDEQAAQRSAARARGPVSPTAPVSTGAGSEGEYDGSMADAGAYSTGGGQGGDARPPGGADMPRNTVKYPPPANIPSGDNDDVVARQLREAAMRESDPALREKLWDEYRKYTGID